MNILMSLICSPNFQLTFSYFDLVTYVTGSNRLTPRSTECKHLLKDSAFNSLQDRICLQNSLGGGSKPILSHPSISLTLPAVEFFMLLTIPNSLFVCLFVALRPESTAMVIAGRSVHLTTLFPGQA